MVLTIAESIVKNDHNIVFSIRSHHIHLASFICISYEDEKTPQTDHLKYPDLTSYN